MTKFEQFLIDRGYIKFVYNYKTMLYNVPKHHILSTMVNIDHRYFHNSDLIALNKIVNGKVLERCDKKGEIIFGLNEFGKPATLISPRPRIGMLITDDLMNNLLSQVEHEVILKAMYSDLKLNDLVNLVD